MAVEVYRERIPSVDARLGRHVHHDPRSRAFAFPTAGLTLKSVRHTRRIPVLDQGSIGSCTGNAGIGCLGTDPFYLTIVATALTNPTGGSTVPVPMFGLGPHYPLTENGAVQLYSDATAADDYPGQYPPDDTGSDGLTIAKVLQRAGEIAGYQHTFSLQDALLALTVTPFITGVTWYNSMFDPAPDGRLIVAASSGVAGGHEFVVDQLDAEHERVWMTNSWGTGWGVQGRAYLTWDDYGTLLADQGDVTVFVPVTQPAPTPVPGDVDQELAAAARHRGWVDRRHVGETAHVALALQAWLTAHGM